MGISLTTRGKKNFGLLEFLNFEQETSSIEVVSCSSYKLVPGSWKIMCIPGLVSLAAEYRQVAGYKSSLIRSPMEEQYVTVLYYPQPQPKPRQSVAVGLFVPVSAST